MKIYVGHSTGFDYIHELYQPLKESFLSNKHQFIFPHEKNSAPLNSKSTIFSCDLFIAEVSYPSTGLGIELGLASHANCKILCVAKENSKISDSLKIICSNFLLYSNPSALIDALVEVIR